MSSSSAPALLNLLWLASPALPVGGFSYSEGLEAAVESGLVRDESQAADWLVHQLKLSLARADLALLAQAFAAWSAALAIEASAQTSAEAPAAAVAGAAVPEAAAKRLQSLNDWVRTTRESSEFRQQTEQMGRSLTDWLRQRQPGDARVACLGALSPAPTWPIAFALAANFSGAALRDVLLTHAFGWAENMVQAAIKAVPLGQSAGQRILSRLCEAIPEAVDHALALSDDQRQAFSPMLAILSAQHEAQYSRIFRS